MLLRKPAQRQRASSPVASGRHGFGGSNCDANPNGDHRWIGLFFLLPIGFYFWGTRYF